MGATLAFGTAGCLGGEGEDTKTTAENGDRSTTEPGGETAEKPEEGEVTFAVDHAGTEMDWGEAYSVTITARAGEDPPPVGTAVLYQTGDDAEWSGSFGNAETAWQLESGESESKTFEIEPPVVGDLTIGVMESTEQTVVEEWDLTVRPPTAAFGESIPYYDGLDVTIDVALHEWLDFELLKRDQGDEAGMYSIRPTEGQWVKVNVTAENTNTNTDVRLPGYDAFSALAGSDQLEHPRYLGETVGAGTRFEVDDQTRHEEGAWMEMNDGGEPDQEGFWLPPSELVSEAVEEGWLLFETKPDTTPEDLEIRLNRNDVRATWE